MQQPLLRSAASALYAVAALLLFHPVAVSQGQEDTLYAKERRLPWHTTPAVLRIQSIAVLDPGQDLMFLDPPATNTLMTITQNLPREDDHTVAPRNLAWWALFHYEATGHIRDDDTLDPDALLSSLKEQNREEQDERRRSGLPNLVLEGWSVPPHYDRITHNLEWGTRLRSEGHEAINYTVRVLGREGLISAQLVTGPATFDSDLASFRTALRRLSFVRSQAYTEYRQGDHVAAYGLAALVAGGATAAAASAGIFKTFGKFIAVALFGGAAAIAGFFKRLFGKTTTNT